MSDLFNSNPTKMQQPKNEYTAVDIEVLEGLEPVRHRPGMYIGGTDEAARHHLVSEVFDNSMDEAVAGFATYIEISMHEDGSITIADNGRGIPVDPHPKYPDKSALEVILTTLHSGGKFSNKVYYTSGGLHGVGISVVNALSEKLEVEVKRDEKIYRQTYSKGDATSKLEVVGQCKPKEHGTKITFYPDDSIFDKGTKFRPYRLYNQAKSKAYLFKGVEIRWNCAESLIDENAKNKAPVSEIIRFPNGIADYLVSSIKKESTVTDEPFTGEGIFPEKAGRVEWAVHWAYLRDVKTRSYCNTVPTPQGGTHETGLRNALFKGLREFGELAGNKKAGSITADDVFNTVHGIISLFIPNPQFQGQTKDKLSNREVIRLVEHAIKDRFDHWLTDNKDAALELLGFVVDRAEERLSRRQTREIVRKTVVQKIRLPGKLADCTRQAPEGAEIFLVEGDSAGGSAKMARNRETQAILPLRGKILNVASATRDKIMQNQEIKDMGLAFGCGVGDAYREEDLRYEKIIIMTDADVDGAHIASLLMTYFYKFMPKMIKQGHLYLAQPPLFRVTQGTKSFYASDESEKNRLVKELEKGRGNVDVGRFKGLGEMTPAQLKETTMNPESRVLLKVSIDEDKQELAATRVEELMGKKPELRYKFITEQSAVMGDEFKANLDV
ncbi:MAG: DNA topoisomerase IV subunit B [Rickettsiales bacterium]|nr:DNA topoisomerase IV subunit B [Pseudomonadota bacterium]MDA0965867.1 DNA topoisomerase IV subunit B [Pseudomonadota bacterium]MDG4542663.1 DNA topoisomerase IV subunit B [Rickettsiales bacterium]MDG4545167.1 DNA topoisomerase IV subunit B [Rickettsiales bacterium]MDG4547290.1 DNA topoisomerase IV subunit B [Rickettsiales bacterium]